MKKPQSVQVVISVRLASWLAVTNCNIAVFSHIMNMINIKLCRIVILIVFLPLCFGVNKFIPSVVALTLFQGHRCVRAINCKLCL